MTVVGSAATQQRWIYALLDPRTRRVRYVGQTRKSLDQRLTGHLRAARRGVVSYKNNWLRELEALGLVPDVRVLEQGVWDQGMTNNREEFWIKRYRSISGKLLTNQIDGAFVVHGPRAPSKSRGASVKKWVATPEGQAQRRAAMKKRYADDPTRRMSDTASGRAFFQDPENAAWLAARLQKLYEDEPERRATIAAQSRERWADPEYKARKTLQSPEYRAQRSKLAKAVTNRRYTCDSCGHESNPNNLSRHQKARGHSGRTLISQVEVI